MLQCRPTDLFAQGSRWLAKTAERRPKRSLAKKTIQNTVLCIYREPKPLETLLRLEECCAFPSAILQMFPASVSARHSACRHCPFVPWVCVCVCLFVFARTAVDAVNPRTGEWSIQDHAFWRKVLLLLDALAGNACVKQCTARETKGNEGNNESALRSEPNIPREQSRKQCASADDLVLKRNRAQQTLLNSLSSISGVLKREWRHVNACEQSCELPESGIA